MNSMGALIAVFHIRKILVRFLHHVAKFAFIFSIDGADCRVLR